MLIGQYSSKITSKRRIAIPKGIRVHLGESFIASRWYEESLVLFSKDDWNALSRKLIGKRKMAVLPVRDTERFILGSAYELTVDSQGRVVMPSALIKFAKLESAVIFLGLGDRVEVWSEKEWEKREEFITKNAAKFVEELSKNDEINNK